jgi:hypothetical protein
MLEGVFILVVTDLSNWCACVWTTNHVQKCAITFWGLAWGSKYQWGNLESEGQVMTEYYGSERVWIPECRTSFHVYEYMTNQCTEQMHPLSGGFVIRSRQRTLERKIRWVWRRVAVHIVMLRSSASRRRAPPKDPPIQTQSLRPNRLAIWQRFSRRIPYSTV